MASFQESLQGRLILDSGRLIGSYFDRSVILICRHDASGCFGLVLNRPTGRTLGTAVKESLGESISKIPLHQGGPVQSETVNFLQINETGSHAEVLPGVSLSVVPTVLEGETWKKGMERKVRAYVGYAGWTGGQLENEMEEQCWITHKATTELVFHKNPKELWKQILTEKGGLFALMARSPDDPSLN